MPIYEYACSSCGHEDELIQKASDRPKRKCPSCGRMTFKRKISKPNFRLKGTGWYETDFKNKGKAAKDGETKKSDKADDKAADKPAEKSSDKKKSSDTAVSDSKKTGTQKNANQSVA